MQGGDTTKKLKDAKKLLRKIEWANKYDASANKTEQQLLLLKTKTLGGERESRPNPKDTKETKNTTEANVCRLNGHNHLLSNCPNNPHGKNYSGISFREIIRTEREAKRSQGNTDDKDQSGTKRKHDSGEVNTIEGRGNVSFADMSYVEGSDWDEDSSTEKPRNKDLW